MTTTTPEPGTNWICARCERRYAYRPARHARHALARVRVGACPPCAAHVRALCQGAAPPLPAELGEIVERLARKMGFNGDHAPAGPGATPGGADHAR